MLTQEEKNFLKYWEENRLREKKVLKQLLVGLPMGAIFGLPVIFILFSGRLWYKRADMVANSSLNPIVLAVAVVLIIIFVAIFYKRHQWDMHEQQYLKLKSMLKKEDPGPEMQQ